MINRHIRWDWNTWLETDKPKVKTMCGRTSSSKYAGIPGVTTQRRLVANKQGVLSPGWCQLCCYHTYKQISELPNIVPTINEVNKLYKIVLALVEDSAKVICKLQLEEYVVPPLERPARSGKQTDIHYELHKLHLSNPLCYLCQKPIGVGVIDHIIPKMRGGTDDLWNLAKVHDVCNSKKGDKTLDQVREIFPKMSLPHWFEV